MMNRKRYILLPLTLVAAMAWAQPKDGYYNAYALDGKSGLDLELALKSIVYPHTRLDYSALWAAYESTDMAPADSLPQDATKTDLVWDMYAFMSQRPHYYSDNDHNQQTGINREHCVPNSWWGGESGNNVAYTDLHHLYPSDGVSNGRKANYPLGVNEGGFTSNWTNGSATLWKVTTTADGVAGGAPFVWEPYDEYKGDIARAYLYVVCAYEGLLNWKTNYMFLNDSQGYTVIKPWALKVLLDWCRKDPVSQKEKDRNDAVERIQKNRNPFVDYPELVEYIWGEKKTTPVEMAKLTCSYNEVAPAEQKEVRLAFVYRVKCGATFKSPALNSTSNGEITYASSDETVATVNATTGVVTGLKPGKVTITATCAETDDYVAASASYDLMVVE